MYRLWPTTILGGNNNNLSKHQGLYLVPFWWSGRLEMHITAWWLFSYLKSDIGAQITTCIRIMKITISTSILIVKWMVDSLVGHDRHQINSVLEIWGLSSKILQILYNCPLPLNKRYIFWRCCFSNIRLFQGECHILFKYVLNLYISMYMCKFS